MKYEAIKRIFSFCRNIWFWCSCYCAWLAAVFSHLCFRKGNDRNVNGHTIKLYESIKRFYYTIYKRCAKA